MIADRSFVHISEVGPVCDEISVRVETPDISFEAALHPTGPYDCQVFAEEFSEGPCAETAL